MYNVHASMKNILRSVGLALLVASAARADYNPILLTPGSFNADAIVEAGAPKGIFTNANMTIDGGTNNNGNTFYETGLETALPWTGLPAAGTTINSQSDATHHYQMPPSYTANNCLMVGGANFPGTTSFVVHKPSGTLTLTSPSAFTALSLMYAGGGAATITVTVHHQDTTIETFTPLSTIDWFNGAAAPVWVARGRVSLDNAQVNTLNTLTATKLLNLDVTLANTTSPVTSVDVAWVSGVARVFVFGLSGSTGGDFNPIAITGFNGDAVVEASAVPNVDSVMATSVTGDGGTNNTSNALYERGFDLAAPLTGMPVHGTTISNATGDHVYTMPATYVGNNCMFLNNPGGTTFQTGTLTPTTPIANCSGLSCLAISAGGANVVNWTVHHADATTEAGSFTIFDWFTPATTPAVYTNQGRFSPENLAFNAVNNTTAVKLYTNDIVCSAASPVTSVDFAWVSGGRSATFALSAQTNALGIFLPVPFSGFDADIVVEAGAYTVNQLYPSPHPAALHGATTITMDGGTNNNANNWFEQGYYPQMPQSGLPHPGQVINSSALPDHHYQMPATYTGNNAIFVDYAHTQANLTISSPQTYSALSFLSSCANGRVTNAAFMQYADGTTESNFFISQDWFNNAPFAFTSLGRMSTDTRCINNDPGRVNPTNNMNPRLYEAQFAFFNIGSPVTNVLLRFLGAQNATSGRIVILAVSATAGAIAPILTVQPNSVVTNDGGTVLFSVQASANAPITYQWQAGPIGGSVFTNLTNGGQTSGATSTNLTISNLGFTNMADYRIIATDAAGSATSIVATLTVLSPFPDVTVPGDPIVAYQPNGGSSPAGETVDHAIENLVGADPGRYYNLGVNGTTLPFAGPVGFIVTPSIGKTTISAMRIYTAPDNAQRDPADYVLEGSNNGGTTWSVIASGPLNLPFARNAAASGALNPYTQALQEIRLSNANGYTSYRWSVNNTRDNPSASGMQIGEIELLGVQSQTPPIITLEPLVSVTNYVGGNPTFITRAIGFPTNLTYQWSRNGSAIPGATKSSYTKPNVQLTDSGSTYAALISNANGSTNTTAATLYVIAAPTQPVPVAIMGDNPIAWWRLDETPDDSLGNNGRVANDYWGGYNGIYTNALIAQPGYNPSLDSDTAAQFGSVAPSDSMVEGVTGMNLSSPTNVPGALSVEAWYKGTVDQIGGAGLISAGFGGGGEIFAIDCGTGNFPTNGLRFYFRDAANASHVVGATNLANDSKWHHVVGVVDEAAGNEFIYIDGIPAGTNLLTPNLGVRGTSTPLTIGARSQNATTNANFQFIGSLDELAVYNRALTPAQVLNHFKAAQFPPIFSLSPTNITVGEATTATLYSSAYGAGTITYQWYDVTGGDPGTPVSGQTSSNLTFNSVSTAQNGTSYRVVATTAFGSVTSTPPATITVVSGPPTLITDIAPTNIVYAGGNVTLTTRVVGTGPFSYQWQHNGVNMSDSARVTGTHSATLSIANSQPSDAGTYQMFVTGAQGSTNSTLETLFIETIPDFNTTGLGWTLNGAPPATISGDLLSLTTGSGGIGNSSAWYNSPLYVGAFQVSFTYQDVGGGGADGVSFTVQNDPRGLTALGGGGGGLGITGITPSAEIEFNIYAPNSPGGGSGGSYAFHVNGANGAYLSAAPVSIDGGRPINVLVTYQGGVVSLSLQDSVTLAVFNTSFAADLPSIVGGQTAYFGFTGAEGGVFSTQTITNFAYIPIVRLTAQQTGPNALTLSWPAQIGGLVLQQADFVTGPYTDISPAPTSPYVVSLAPAKKFYRLHLGVSEP